MNFAKAVCNWNLCLQLHFFEEIQQWLVLSCYRRLSAWPLLTTQNWTFQDSPYISTLWTVYSIQACSEKPMFKLFVNIFSVKKVLLCTHQVLFLKFHILLSHQKFDCRPLFKSEVICFANNLNSLKTNISQD